MVNISLLRNNKLFFFLILYTKILFIIILNNFANLKGVIIFALIIFNYSK